MAGVGSDIFKLHICSIKFSSELLAMPLKVDSFLLEINIFLHHSC